MNADEIRKKYLEFFKEKGHSIIPSASLIPENDPTVLFTTAGMHPLVPYLLGEKHPAGKRLASCQKCIRTGDIEEVGDAIHLTFFEMLGNWSLGDYFKKEAIEWSFEFLTNKKWLGLDKNRIAVSVFAGNENVPFDSEAFEIWRSLGIPEKRIAKLQGNWWGPAGETGPCGSDTEMFYWSGNENDIPESFDDNNLLWVEIWNDVFMEFNKTKEGKFVLLNQKNVDTGMGFERVVAVLNETDIYRTELFLPTMKKIEELSGKKYGDDNETDREIRIVADHVRAATFIMGDENGVLPSNTGQGYVVRRLIRRAVRYGKILKIKENFIPEIAEKVIETFSEYYLELLKNKGKIINELEKEEKKFLLTLNNGLKELKKMALGAFQQSINGSVIETAGMKINGKNIFYLYQTYGFPFELSIEELNKIRKHYKKGGYDFLEPLSTAEIKDLRESYDEELKKHQELSRTASAGVFKGGLADNSEITTKYHTATHLTLAAMRQVLGPETYQKGSNITAERMRFDFNYGDKLTTEQIKEIEDVVNEKISENIPVEMLEMPKEEALKIAKISFDQSKYGDVVKVYKIGDFSVELCGGPHVNRTGEIGHFQIIKEEAVSAGTRRIKAVVS